MTFEVAAKVSAMLNGSDSEAEEPVIDEEAIANEEIAKANEEAETSEDETPASS